MAMDGGRPMATSQGRGVLIDGRSFAALYEAPRHRAVSPHLTKMGAAQTKLVKRFREGRLRKAAETGKNNQILHQLQFSKVDLNAQDDRGRSALMLAAYHGKTAIVKTLLEAGADTRVCAKGTGWTALVFAARYGYVDIVRLLIAHGSNVNVRDNKGFTPLHHCARYSAATSAEEQQATASALLESGALLETTDFLDSTTPLHIASASGNCSVLVVLINNGAMMEARDARGATPLIIASTHQHEQTVATLVVAGANLEAHDDTGQTALSYASGARGNMVVAQTLLEGGADASRCLDS